MKHIKRFNENINETHNTKSDIILEEYDSWMPPAMEKELQEMMKRDDEIGALARMIKQLRGQIGSKVDPDYSHDRF